MSTDQLMSEDRKDLGANSDLAADVRHSAVAAEWEQWLDRVATPALRQAAERLHSSGSQSQLAAPLGFPPRAGIEVIDPADSTRPNAAYMLFLGTDVSGAPAVMKQIRVYSDEHTLDSNQVALSTHDVPFFDSETESRGRSIGQITADEIISDFDQYLTAFNDRTNLSLYQRAEVSD